MSEKSDAFKLCVDSGAWAEAIGLHKDIENEEMDAATKAKFMAHCGHLLKEAEDRQNHERNPADRAAADPVAAGP